jgi:uncharacterized repeat protein (TIGR02543 family)
MAAKIFEVGDVLPATAPQENTYLTFQSTSSFTLKVYDNTKHWDGILYYSTDTTTWNVWNGTTTLNSVGNKLYLRGTGNTVITGSSTNYRWVLTGSNIECIGNIENLLDYETVALGNHPTMASACYRSMFQGCTSLTTAPSLPATTLTKACYRSMFDGCTSLTTAPSLPATTLATDCYYSMFQGCTSLTTAPSLLATTLTSACYRSMFDGCTSLTTAPSLPATTLAFNCYQFMFQDCTSLTTAPSLPATTLIDSCYYSMFEGCTSLTTAPSLPATTLATDCYRSMFRGCTAFKVSTTKMGSYQYEWRIPTSGTGTIASNWNLNMLSNTGGTFTYDPYINATYYVENPPVSRSGYNITFEENGGTSVTDLPEQTALPNPLPIPTKSGYTFRGWYYDSDFTNEAFADDPLTGDVTLYAKWELNTYTITYNSNGGSTIPQTSGATQLPNPLPIPTKSGYTFVAWYYESNFQTRANAGDTIESNVTLYAKWHNLGSLFTEIADAIREKESSSGTIRDVDFGERIKQIQGAKEEQSKTVSPSTSQQVVTPDSGKVLNQVTVNAIPTETKSQQPNLSSGDQTINATSGKFMTSFTITKDTINHIASNIRSGITLYGVTGNLQPAKEEETKTVTPNFSGGNVVVTPTSGKVLSQVTINKDSNLVASNIKKDVTVHGITGTLEVGGAELPSTAGGSIFTGATIPLTYKNNTHDYENNYEYKSATHNITITGLDGRATITGNGTKNVLVAFDVTSSTSSLKNFTITCVNGEQELTYKGLHAHYGETVTGILTFAYNNITRDGSEGTFDTSGLTANYKFIVTSSNDLPIFSEDTTLWNTIYSYQLLNVLMGNFSGTSIGNYFMSYCFALNQPLTLPSSLSSIGDNFMSYCFALNQPLTLPSGLSSIGTYFMSDCYAFNQPLTLPSSLSSIGSNFMYYCYAFNQPLTLPSSLSSIGDNFMSYCYAFNQPLTLPSGLSSIGNDFMSYCRAFNQLLTLPSSLSSIGSNFMYYCYAFNQPLTLPSSLSSIGSNFMYYCYAFNQPLTLPSSLSSIGNYFMSYCYAFNQPLTLPSSLSSIGNYFMSYCYAFNQPLTLPSSLSSIGNYFMSSCRAFNQVLTLPSGLSSIGSNFMSGCYTLSTIIWNASVYPTDNNSLSQGVNAKTNSTYGAGIKVYGTKRAQLISALPNKTSNPFRKLINGGS